MKQGYDLAEKPLALSSKALMNKPPTPNEDPRSWQRSIPDCRVGPPNPFIEFKKEEIEQSIPDRFEQQVQKHSDRIAVRAKCHELNYDALNKTANRVARAILSQRGEGEEPIALLLEKGAPVIAAILGVLKADKMYVPL